MIPICLVSGFLGCGKTTFLKNVAKRKLNHRIVYLVNEFASVDIDGELIRKNSREVVTVPGGSIFCKCLVGEFIKQMRLIISEFHSDKTPLNGVLIEASGMANPKVILDMLDETGLGKEYRLSRVISVTDPRSLLILLNTLPNIKAQIETSDIILLNKTDLYPEEQIRLAEEKIYALNKTAQVIRTVYCDTKVELFNQAPVKEVHGEYAKCKDPLFDSHTCKIACPVDLQQLRMQLERFRDEIYRAKGFVPTGSGFFYVDFSQAGFSVCPTEKEDEEKSVLAFIIKGQASADLLSFINGIRSTYDK